jgi:hypothetical protein
VHPNEKSARKYDLWEGSGERERGERERKKEREREREREQCKADEKERGRVRDGAYIVNNYDAVKNFALLFDPSV